VVLGPGLAGRRAQSRSDADPRTDAELRFHLGRTIELARPRRIFAHAAGGFAKFVAALLHAAGRTSADPSVAAEGDRLRTALPVKLRTRLAERLPPLSAGDLDPERFVAACHRAADRAGLIASGHTAVAIELAGGAAAAPHLVRLAASSAYLDARRRLRR
jgi:hypothetical protein